MSLTTKIKRDDDWNRLFKEITPKKNQLKTVSGKKPCSNEYEILAEYHLEQVKDAAIVGTAFDYIARFMVSKETEKRKEMVFEDLVALEGLRKCMGAAADKEIDITAISETYIKTCRQFVAGECDLDPLIRAVIFLGKIEQVYRSGMYSFEVDISKILACEDAYIEDLKNLSNVFYDKFIGSGLVKKDSIVVYNPTFGGASVLCGGADADIFIDGTLYDFKCTVKKGYAWTDVAQVLGYYLLDQVAKKYKDEENDLKDYEIKRIALYHARYGEVAYIDMSEAEYEDSIEKISCMLGKEEYEEYIERSYFEEVTAPVIRVFNINNI